MEPAGGEARLDGPQAAVRLEDDIGGDGDGGCLGVVRFALRAIATADPLHARRHADALPDLLQALDTFAAVGLCVEMGGSNRSEADYVPPTHGHIAGTIGLASRHVQET